MLEVYQGGKMVEVVEERCESVGGSCGRAMEGAAPRKSKTRVAKSGEDERERQW